MIITVDGKEIPVVKKSVQFYRDNVVHPQGYYVARKDLSKGIVYYIPIGGETGFNDSIYVHKDDYDSENYLHVGNCPCILLEIRDNK